jgi:nucleoside-triphosphatase THEP1
MHLVNALVPQRKRSLSKELRTVLETAFLILTTVDEIGVVEGKLNSTVDNVVDGLDTQHKGVVLVTDLIAP